jgi:hypothetical protein
MTRLRENLMVRAATWVVLAGGLCQSTLGREVKLTIYPQKTSAEAGKYSLLSPPASLTDGDAVPLYDKAIQALPGKASDNQVQQYLKMEIDKLPADQVEQTLKPYIESFKYTAQAVKCRACNWPAWNPETMMVKNSEYRRLAFAVRLWARLEVSQGECEGAILPLQIGFGMAKHMGQTPNLLQLQMGVASAEAMCAETERFVQREDSPNLYSVLASLPRPFVDAEKAVKNADDRTGVLLKRLDSNLGLLQCIEAIRSYAASHAGQLPQSLAEIKEVAVPNDPMCGAPFRYSRTGTTAVLESTVSAGGETRDEVHYQITVKK